MSSMGFLSKMKGFFSRSKDKSKSYNIRCKLHHSTLYKTPKTEVRFQR